MTGAAFARPVAIFATIALLLSIPFAGSAAASTLTLLLLFATSCVISLWLAASPAPLALRMALAGALAIGPVAVEILRAAWWNASLDNLLAALFGAHGLLYGAPLLWGGFLGLISLRHEKPALVRLVLAAIVPGTLGLALATGQPNPSSRALTWAPFLLPGLAACFERVRSFAVRRPERVIAGAAGLLILWNLLFMEQYRQRLLPSDDTVSFAQVTSNSAGLLSRAVGTPFAWPANWIFAWRFHAPPDRWDAVADRRLFADARTAIATIEFGDDASSFAPDTPLFLEGFGDRRTCGRGWCRDLDGAGRLLLPLREVRGDLILRVRARGQGALHLSMNGASTSAEMSEALSDITLRVAGRFLRRGANVLSLSTDGGAKATIDRLTLERDLASASAR